MIHNNKLIEDYTKSMFKYNHLNIEWINICKNYLNNNLVEYFKDKHVLDYGFGRGNWGLAFLKAGAKSVTFIDKSNFNCNKLHQWIKANHHFKNVEIICGDIIENNLKLNKKFDFIWLHGVLQHVKDDKTLIKNLTSFLSNNGYMHVYAYEKDSFREWITNTLRSLFEIKNEKNYRKHSFYLSNFARRRLSDDLTAPYIKFYSIREIQNLLKGCGFNHISNHFTFDEFLKLNTKEFRPHEFLCSRVGPVQSKVIVENKSNKFDLILNDYLFKCIKTFKKLKIKSQKSKDQFGIGLANNYYSGLAISFEQCIIQIFKYQFYYIIENKIPFMKTTIINENFIKFCFKKLEGKKIKFDKKIKSVLIDEFNKNSLIL